MSLVNDMSVDVNGGVCLKKHYSFYTYNKINTGYTSNYVTGYTDTNIQTGEYVLVYKNTNVNYNIDIYNTKICLILSGTTINEWVDSYINSLVTTGYTGGYDNSTFENRIIYDIADNNYYKIEYYINTTYCSGNTNELWAIVNNSDESIWKPGETTYYYNELDSCGLETGKKIITLKNINDISNTKYTTKYIEKRD